MKKNPLKLRIKIFLSLLFLGCLWDWSYGYYQFVRFLGMVGFIVLFSLDSNTSKIKYLWLASAILINPIFKISLGRQIWNLVDILWVILFISTHLWEKNQLKINDTNQL